MKNAIRIVALEDSFLSHLCGDEGLSGFYDNQKVFLSHLCGDEVVADKFLPLTFFLSHLCGDEVLNRIARG